jgi:hypothetical protein
MKKVGITFVKKSELKDYSGGSKPRAFVNNRTNFKSKVHQHANEKQDITADKPQDTSYKTVIKS